MVILHIASLKNNNCSGVDVIVPQHIKSQSKFAEVGFVNIDDYEIDYVNQFKFRKYISISALPTPFNKPDLVVFHQVYYFKYLKIANELRRLNIPYIIVPHGCLTKEALNIKWLKKRLGNILFFNKFINKASALQFLSVKEAETTNYKNKRFIGTNGINFPSKHKNNFNDENVNFTYIGRLDVYHKGLDLLLSSFGKIADCLRKSNAVLNIYGPLSEMKTGEIKDLIDESGVSDLVNLKNAVTGTDKINILLDTDIFIQTSRFEGMPMGILEALSYGLPCVVTNGTNLGELINDYDAGWVAETSIESIAEKIEKAICERDKLQIKSNNSVRLVEENFDWKKVSKETVLNYKKIIECFKMNTVMENQKI